MSLARMLASWSDHLQSGASVKSVFGEPIEAEGRTLIPVAKVRYGFGAGGGKSKADEDESKDHVEGGGGGGGSAAAVGVLEVTSEGTRFIPVHSSLKLYGAVAAGLLVGLWLGRRR